MLTITKQDLIDTIYEQMGFNLRQSKLAAEELIDITKSAIYHRESVIINNVGRIIPVVKSPRPARNPRTGEAAIVTRRHSITMSKVTKNKLSTEKLNIGQYRHKLQMLGYTSARAAELTDIWVTFLGQVLTGKCRIEIRGLGVFYPRTSNPNALRRNPKTGAPAKASGLPRIAFKCSSSLRKAMDAQYLV